MNEDEDDDFTDDWHPEWPPPNACIACIGDGWRMAWQDADVVPVTCTVCNGSGRREEGSK